MKYTNAQLALLLAVKMRTTNSSSSIVESTAKDSLKWLENNSKQKQ